LNGTWAEKNAWNRFAPLVCRCRVRAAVFSALNSKAAEILALPADLQNRAIAMERNADLTSIKGLGRRWRWEDLITSDRQQMDMFTQPVDMPCGCYDGDAA
jgi:hypothetical protein